MTGSLVFGIGTQSTNGLNGATVYGLNDLGNFTTSFNNQSYDQSFLDSGSNEFPNCEQGRNPGLYRRYILLLPVEHAEFYGDQSRIQRSERSNQVQRGQC